MDHAYGSLQFSEAEPAILDLIDDFRTKEEIKLRDKAAGNYTEPIPTIQTEFEGHGTLIVAKETINSKEPLCVGIGPKGHKVSNFFLILFFYSLVRMSC